MSLPVLEDGGDRAATVLTTEILDDELLSQRAFLQHVNVLLHRALDDNRDEDDSLHHANHGEDQDEQDDHHLKKQRFWVSDSLYGVAARKIAPNSQGEL